MGEGIAASFEAGVGKIIIVCCGGEEEEEEEGSIEEEGEMVLDFGDRRCHLNEEGGWLRQEGGSVSCLEDQVYTPCFYHFEFSGYKII